MAKDVLLRKRLDDLCAYCVKKYPIAGYALAVSVQRAATASDPTMYNSEEKVEIAIKHEEECIRIRGEREYLKERKKAYGKSIDEMRAYLMAMEDEGKEEQRWEKVGML